MSEGNAKPRMMRAKLRRRIMKHATTMMIAAALAASVSGPADASWKKFWKQVTSKECWQRFSTTDEGFKQNCKI